MMAAMGRATRARALAALVILLWAVVEAHAQCVPPPPFADQRVYYHLDQVGSVNLLTDHTGGVVRESRHYPYGTFIGGPPAASSSPFGFSSHRTEDSHGLAYFEARYYIPELAVFASRDPAAQYQNPYSYAEGDPLGLHDPDGKNFGIWGFVIAWIGNTVLDDLLNPPQEAVAGRRYTAEEQAVPPAPEPTVSLPGASATVNTASRVVRMADDVPKVADDVVAAGKTALGNLTPGEARRIQAFVDKFGAEVNVVGSRAAGKVKPLSDFDYVIGGNSALRHSALRYLPRGKAGGELRGSNWSGIEIFNANKTPLDPTRPFIQFTPGRPPVVGP
jgi:RHS repeat-associated protein